MRRFVPAAALAFLPWLSPAAPLISHTMQIKLEPAEGRLEVTDHVRLPEHVLEAGTPLHLELHAGLSPSVEGGGAFLTPEAPIEGDVPIQRYRIVLSPHRNDFTLHYAGAIRHALSDEGLSRREASTPGLIGPQGVYLDGSSYWYPRLGEDMVRFSMKVRLPQGWQAVSQGARHQAQDSVLWEEDKPQDDIWLVAGPYHTYARRAQEAETLVYLHQPDQALAKRYLDATGRYLDFYSRLLGPYPYAKFALVENFWETGYGMPSFTLLGPRVIRLPFILYSSYPHEILHNWWGNGVYVDYSGGNWSEGLTAYLADHLLKEEQGEGAEYRRSALQRYADYVAEARDFPLTAFRARHGEVTQAVGYDKALMVFHMLRRNLGDSTFVHGLRRFYSDNLFRRAAWSDLRAAFEAVSGKDLRPYFQQWLERPGAPSLALRNVRVESAGSGYRLRAELIQTQDGPAYALGIPVAVQTAADGAAVEQVVPMHGRSVALDLALPDAPLRLDVDPRFDLFRRLDPGEIPASLGLLLGAGRPLFVLPSAAPAELRQAYRGLALAWSHDPQAVAEDAALRRLPTDRPVWLLGWDNRFRSALAPALAAAGAAQAATEATVAGKPLPRGDLSVVLAVRRADAPDYGLAWVGCDNPRALPGLARKLPHYGKYSFLAFEGDAPDNVLKGQWPVAHSPLSVTLEGKHPLAPLHLAPRPALSAQVSSSASPEHHP